MGTAISLFQPTLAHCKDNPSKTLLLLRYPQRLSLPHQSCSMEASKQISSLEEQLHSVAAQRDEISLQLSDTQDQCTQYNTQLSNLELVLEQFQAGV